MLKKHSRKKSICTMASLERWGESSPLLKTWPDTLPFTCPPTRLESKMHNRVSHCNAPHCEKHTARQSSATSVLKDGSRATRLDCGFVALPRRCDGCDTAEECLDSAASGGSSQTPPSPSSPSPTSPISLASISTTSSLVLC